MAIEILPAALLSKDKWDDFLLFLRMLPVDGQDKKYLLMSWCQIVGAALTEDMVDAVLGGRAEKTRG